MKKFLVLCLTLVMVLSSSVLFSSCGTTGESNGEADVKIGVLHLGSVAEPTGYTAAHETAIVKMISSLGLKNSQVIRKEEVSDTDEEEINANIDSLVAEGCTLIIGTSFGYMDPMAAKAKEYPDVMFSHATGYKSSENMNNFFGRIYQARYLSGIVAGLKTETGNIGYSCAFDTTIAECSSGVNAFALGVQAVNPDATVYVKTLQSWYNPTQEKLNSEALLDLGCDVLTHHGDTKEPCQAAKAANKFSIGYNTDMGEFVDETSVLTSVIWHWEVYYTQLVEKFLAGKFSEVGNYYGGFETGLYGLADLSESVDPTTAEILKLVEGLLTEGSWDVFSGKVLSFAGEAGAMTVAQTEETLMKHAQDSDVLEPAGEVTDFNITGSMPYYVAGVKYVS